MPRIVLTFKVDENNLAQRNLNTFLKVFKNCYLIECKCTQVDFLGTNSKYYISSRSFAKTIKIISKTMTQNKKLMLMNSFRIRILIECWALITKPLTEF